MVNQLRGRLEEHNDNRASVQARLDETCARLREQISAMEENVNNALMEVFTKEDSEIQEILCGILKFAGIKKRGPKQNKALAALVAKAKAELLVKSSYDLKKRLSFSFSFDEITSEDNDEAKALIVYGQGTKAGARTRTRAGTGTRARARPPSCTS